MNRISRGLIAGLVMGQLALAADIAAARPMTPAEKRDVWVSTDMPACDSPFVLGKITSKFGRREGRYWKSGLAIEGFDRIVETGYRTNGLDYLARRYCTGRVVLNDGKARKVTYAIAGDMGWLGVIGFGVEWCVEGLDRNFAYGGECRAARP